MEKRAKRGEKLHRNRWALKETHTVHSQYLVSRSRSHVLSEDPPGHHLPFPGKEADLGQKVRDF
jgi:hypothetical protein